MFEKQLPCICALQGNSDAKQVRVRSSLSPSLCSLSNNLLIHPRSSPLSPLLSVVHLVTPIASSQIMEQSNFSFKAWPAYKTCGKVNTCRIYIVDLPELLIFFTIWHLSSYSLVMLLTDSNWFVNWFQLNLIWFDRICLRVPTIDFCGLAPIGSNYSRWSSAVSQ